MGERKPRLDRRRFQKILKRNGYKMVRQTGDHLIYSNGKKTISINRHLNAMVALRLLKQNKLKYY